MKTYYGLIGAGGHGREFMPMLRASLAQELAQGDVETLFVVEGQQAEGQVNGHRLLGLDAFLALEGRKYFNVAIGDSRVRQRIAELCLAGGATPFSALAPSAIVLEANELADGYLVSEQTVITANVKIGRFFQANCHCNISHDCVIGDYVTFAPGVRCNGNVSIGDHAYIGAGALIRQGRHGEPLRIGEGAVVGMGAVVLRDVPPYTTVVGNPARPLPAP